MLLSQPFQKVHNIPKTTEYKQTKELSYYKPFYDLQRLTGPPAMDERKRKSAVDEFDYGEGLINSTDACRDISLKGRASKRQKILDSECEKKEFCDDFKRFSQKRISTQGDTSPSENGYSTFSQTRNETSSSSNYELRPRIFLRRPTYKRDSGDEDSSSAVEILQGKRKEKSAQRLSKYRRRTANARERHRMKEINAAFKTLREVLPQPIKMKESNLTKITTLRLAVDYIQALDDLLRDPNLELTDSNFGLQSSTSILKGHVPSLHPVVDQDPNTTFPTDAFGNSLSDFLFGLTSTSSPIESLCESSSDHPSIPNSCLKEVPRKNCSVAPNFSNYSFNFDDDALIALRSSSHDDDSSTIDSIAILLSKDLDDDVF